MFYVLHPSESKRKQLNADFRNIVLHLYGKGIHAISELTHFENFRVYAYNAYLYVSIMAVALGVKMRKVTINQRLFHMKNHCRVPFFVKH